MKRKTAPLPDWLRVGTRLTRICQCDTPHPGEYVVVHIGAERKMAWARGPGNRETILRSYSFGDWGERYERID